MSVPESKLSIGFYVNAGLQFTMLNLDYLNLKFVGLNSPEFRTFIEELSLDKPQYQANLDGFQEYINSDFLNYIYIAIPVDKTKYVHSETYYELMKAIVLFHPCKLKLMRVAHFEYENETTTHYYHSCSELMTELPLVPKTTKFVAPQEVNWFIKLYFDRIKEYKYLHIPLSYYANSFGHNDKYMGFINLCISIEALIEGETEVTYKIRRCCAVINSSSMDMGNIIFKNVGKIYAHRSQIVHGSGGNPNTINKHYNYLSILVSNTLLRLLLSPIKEKPELNTLLTQLGFDDINSPFKDSKMFPILESSRFDFNMKLEDMPN